MTKCQQCKHGACGHGFKRIVYSFRQAIKKVDRKIITIDYKNGELGCKKSINNQKEKDCLSNNFCNFEEFIY